MLAGTHAAWCASQRHITALSSTTYGIVLLLATLLSCAGCVAASPPQSRVMPTASTNPLILPLDRYRLTNADVKREQEALYILETRCRSRNHVGLSIPTAALGGDLQDHLGNTRRYGIIDAGAAAARGYHLPNMASQIGAEKAAARWIHSLTTHKYAIYRICRYKAVGKISDGVRTAPVSLATLDFKSFAMLKQTPAARRANKRWSACMRSRGFRYSSPLAAMADPRWKLNQSLPSRQERATALADVACKQATGLTASYASAEARIENRLISGHATAISIISANIDAIRSNTSKVLDAD